MCSPEALPSGLNSGDKDDEAKVGCDEPMKCELIGMKG